MSFDLETLYGLLPAVYRIRDLEQSTGPDESSQPLWALLQVFVEQIGILEENLAQLYDDQFIETCAEWVVPYIGDLVGYRMPYLISSHNLRNDVANTLDYRRRKGTALLMEQMLQDITGWSVHIVEYFELIAASQHVNRPDAGNHLINVGASFAEIPSGGQVTRAQELEMLGTPFERSVHTIDVRNTSSEHGRYNIANIGVFVWRLPVYSLTGATAARAFATDAHRYRFSPLGNDLQLFNLPRSNVPATQLVGPLAVAMPIGRSQLRRSLSDYYGSGKSLGLTIVDEEGKRTHVHSDAITVNDLSDSVDSDGNPIKDAEGNPTWATLSEDSTVIDPVLGRIAFPKHIRPVHVSSTFHYGFSADIGGGEYPRATSFSRGLHIIEHVPSPHPSISQALNALHAHAEHVVSQRSKRDAALKAMDAVPAHAGYGASLRSASHASSQALHVVSADTENGVVEITDSGTYEELPVIRAIDTQCIELRAADSCRPLLKLNAPTGIAEMQISGEEQCHVILNGLIISNGILRITGNLGRLSLRHCTLVPGLSLSQTGEPQHPHQPGLIIDSPRTLVEIDHCIVGALHVKESAQVRITNSIVDATSKQGVAYAAHAGSSTHPTSPGGSLSIENSTIIGRVHTVSLELASNTIFLASPGANKEPPLNVERRQEGCVRYSYVPYDSRTPRCYQCQPQASNAEDIEEPVFTSLRYGNPGYCQLLLRSPVNIRMNIRKGADDQSEMGVFHDLLQPQRAANLHLRLREYLPFAMQPGVMYMT